MKNDQAETTQEIVLGNGDPEVIVKFKTASNNGNPIALAWREKVERMLNKEWNTNSEKIK